MKAVSRIFRFIRARSWMPTALAFLIIQLIFILFEITSWTPNFREGNLFERIANSAYFTEQFAPYSTPELNLLTAFFAVTLLPAALLSAVKDAFSRKRA